MSISDLRTPSVADFERWLVLQDLAPRTVEQRAELAARLERQFGTLHLTREQTVMWLRGYQGWTRITYQNHLSSMFKWMIATGRAAENHALALRRTPPPRPKPNPLDEADVDAVLAAAEGDVRAFVLLGLYAGLRGFEIAKFRGEEITERSISLFGKGGQGAMVPTHPILWELAQDYPSRGWWFPADNALGHVTTMVLQHSIYGLFRPLGIEGNIHRTRATYGTRLIRSGANIRVVQELMRHRSLRSTEHYLKAADDELGRAIRGLPPAA